MSNPKNPFAKSRARPGEGQIELSLQQPSKQVLTAFEYQYPLKLISPDPHTVEVRDPNKSDGSQTEIPVTTVFLLTYGGGLIAGDSINLTITLNPHTRLALLTQGSTKIFKSKAATNPQKPSSTIASPFTSPPEQPTRQILNVKISPHSALCYLPDPNQPFTNSIYEQRQTFYVDPYGSSSLCFLDWVSEGRSALNEHWTLTSWTGRTEVREHDESSKGRLLIRDSLLLSSDELASLHAKTDGKGILGTLIIYGPLFKSLADFFTTKFKALPRIGAKKWATTPRPKTPAIIEEDEERTGAEGPEDYFSLGMTNTSAGGWPTTPRAKRKQEDEIEGLLWTAAQVRGFVLVKFAAKDVDGARRWLAAMLRSEGSVERQFGHQALLCLK